MASVDSEARLWLMRFGSRGDAPAPRMASRGASKRRVPTAKVLEWSALAAGAAILACWAY
ncbi:MAG: hypothetical protein PWQ57_155 [Desulfovibrionales bacterium]|nr:hypothetical protein [Desulfovibrionales bacterium]